MLLGQEADDVHRISLELSFHLRCMGTRRLREGQAVLILRGDFNKGQGILGPSELDFGIGGGENGGTMAL
jgi:hypothetical protein